MTSGKVVLVPFPFDDLSTTKVRPAACLTAPIGPHRHVVLAFISSQVPAVLDRTDLLLDPADADFAAGMQSETGSTRAPACADRRPRRSEADARWSRWGEGFGRFGWSARAPTTAREGACAPLLNFRVTPQGSTASRPGIWHPASGIEPPDA